MPESPPYPGTPRWVKVFGIIAIVVVLLFLHRLLTVGSEHGRLGQSHGSGGHTAPSTVTGDQKPTGGGHR